jgi:hypothetical protein
VAGLHTISAHGNICHIGANSNIEAKNKSMNKEILTGLITCPNCKKATREPIPEAACLYFFECPGCNTVIKALPGDCCVFCSYGDIPCPYVGCN